MQLFEIIMGILSRMISFTLVRDGKPGKPGPIIYPVGKWESNITYTSDENSKPYVEYKGEFYYLNTMKAPVGVDPATDIAQNKGNWVYMEKFKAIFTEVLFADFAKLGSFVIFGDYLISQHGVDSSNRPSTDYQKFPKGFTPNLLINAKTGEFEANKAKIKGHIDAYRGTIGGFEISDGRIGAKVEAGEDEAFGSLALYKDFLRVGGKNGYAMLGDNVLPLSLGGAFNATGRIVNNTPNTGAQWGFDSSNYGLLIDVKGGSKNYGINSNAPLLAPANISTKVAKWNFDFSTYTIDFSQASIFLMYRARYGDINITMPTESSIASQFGMTSLPVGFGFIFTVVAAGGTSKIILNGLYDRNHKLSNFEFTEGNNATILAHKTIDGFEYQLLNYNR